MMTNLDSNLDCCLQTKHRPLYLNSCGPVNHFEGLLARTRDLAEVEMHYQKAVGVMRTVRAL
jgi:hypothetical protein